MPRRFFSSSGEYGGRLFPELTDPSAFHPARPAPPRCRAVRQPVPIRPWFVRVLGSTGLHIPENGLHEKGLQRQTGVGALAGSQEQRALLVSMINSLSTAGQPRFLFPHWFTWDFPCSGFRRDIHNNCPSFARGSEGRFSPGRTDPSASRSARPCFPVAPPCAQPRPDLLVVFSSFGFDRLHKWGRDT